MFVKFFKVWFVVFVKVEFVVCCKFLRSCAEVFRVAGATHLKIERKMSKR